MADLRQRAWARWQAAAGPWRGWAICPALTVPDANAAAAAASARGRVTTPMAAPPASPSQEAEVLDLTEVLRPGGTAVVLDLDPVVGVRSAAEVSRRGLAHVVLVLPRWPHTAAVLPTGELVATLVETSSRLTADPVAFRGRGAVPLGNIVFILDAQRHKTIRRPAQDKRVDNRYAIAAADLPNLAALRRGGITRVVRIAATP